MSPTDLKFAPGMPFSTRGDDRTRATPGSWKRCALAVNIVVGLALLAVVPGSATASWTGTGPAPEPVCSPSDRPIASVQDPHSTGSTIRVPFSLNNTTSVMGTFGIMVLEPSWTSRPRSERLVFDPSGSGGGETVPTAGVNLWDQVWFQLDRSGTYGYELAFADALPGEPAEAKLQLTILRPPTGDRENSEILLDQTRSVRAGGGHTATFQLDSPGKIVVYMFLNGNTSLPDVWSPDRWTASIIAEGGNGSGSDPIAVPWNTTGKYARLATTVLGPGSYQLEIAPPPGAVPPATGFRTEATVAEPDAGPGRCSVPGVVSGFGFLPPMLIGMLVAIILGVAATEHGRYLVGGRLLRGYGAGRGSPLLEQYTRGRIHGYVEANPGASIAQARSDLRLANGTLLYHLSVLEKEGLLVSRRDGIRRRFYPPEKKDEAEHLRTLSTSQILILDMIRDRPGVAQSEIARRAGTSQQVASYHILRLGRAGLVESQPAPRGERRVFLRPERVQALGDGTYRLPDGTVLTAPRPA